MNRTEHFLEIYRVLNNNSAAVVVYNWDHHSLLMNISVMPFKLLKKIIKLPFCILKKLSNKKKSVSNTQEKHNLYFYTYDYEWFMKRLKPLVNFDILVWRSVSVDFMKIYIHPFLYGKYLLSLIYKMENKFPGFLGRYGAYPMVIIKKCIQS